MARSADPVGHLFARLTGELEDACEIATEGRNRRMALGTRADLVVRLRRRLGRMHSILNQID